MLVPPGSIFSLRLTVSELGGKVWSMTRYLQYIAVETCPQETVTEKLEQFLIQAATALAGALTPLSLVSALDAVWREQNLALFRVQTHILGMRLGARLSSVTPALVMTKSVSGHRTGRHQVSGVPSSFVEYQALTAGALAAYALVATKWSTPLTWDYNGRRLAPVYIPEHGYGAARIESFAIRGYTGVYSPRRP